MDLSSVLFFSLAPAVICRADLHCQVYLLCMLTADWSWKGNVPYFMNIMWQRGEGEQRRENQSLWWALNSLRGWVIWLYLINKNKVISNHYYLLLIIIIIIIMINNLSVKLDMQGVDSIKSIWCDSSTNVVSGDNGLKL